MKKWFLLTALAASLTSCYNSKPLASSGNAASRKGEQKPLRFLSDININGAAPAKHQVNNPGTNHATAERPLRATFTIEQGALVQFKYAIRLDTEVERLFNTGLYRYIDEWWGTPYSLGGYTKKGIDCSAFVQELFNHIYQVQLPRTSKEQHSVIETIGESELMEGDLIFFNTRGGISHVGIYLHNHKFVHASTSGGVMISDINEVYWRKRFLAAGRVPQQLSRRN